MISSLFARRSYVELLPVAFCLLLTGVAKGQFEPSSAHVFLYFPQLADGGPFAQNWQTTILFSNPNLLWPAACVLEVRLSDGSPFPMDFGSGELFRHSFFLPPNGSTTLRSRAASSQTRVGWAIASCTAPVMATVLFRAVEQGVPRVEISSPAVSPVGAFYSVASRELGIALANVYPDRPLVIRIDAYDSGGRIAGTATVELCAFCHRAFNLREVIPSLPAGFQGNVSLSSRRPSDVFAAWTLNSDRGLLSSLPTGGVAWPISQHDRIWMVYLKLLNAAVQLFPAVDFGRVRLLIPMERVINATASSDGTIRINLALAELISDSPSELAFIIAHELAHYIQFFTGRTLLHPNAELDADVIGALLGLISGYDPYAGAGVFGKLMMASRRTGLLAQAFDNLNDPHTSFSNRMAVLLDTLTLACQQPAARLACQEYKELIHPTLPPDLPLAEPSISVPQ